nr:helix-turn-helix transcriptional regulator [Treponema sp.]
MFKNKNGSLNNLSGKNIARIRKMTVPNLSQRALADKLQLYGLDLDKNAVQRIECGKRFVTDIELVAISNVLRVPVLKLLEKQESTNDNNSIV